MCCLFGLLTCHNLQLRFYTRQPAGNLGYKSSSWLPLHPHYLLFVLDSTSIPQDRGDPGFKYLNFLKSYRQPKTCHSLSRPPEPQGNRHSNVSSFTLDPHVQIMPSGMGRPFDPSTVVFTKPTPNPTIAYLQHFNESDHAKLEQSSLSDNPLDQPTSPTPSLFE